MPVLSALFIVLLLIGIVVVGVGFTNLHYLFGVVVPYTAIVILLVGLVARVLKWAGAPVPFRIPTTSGQQKSLPWIKSSPLEAPSSLGGVLGRMLLEVLFFRSLFRNTRVTLRSGPKLVYGADKWLWAGGLAFHYSFLVIFFRHFKYFVEPVPGFVTVLQFFDGFFKVGVPEVLLTDLIFLVAVSYLFLRRVAIPSVRYISLPGDYFPLYLLLSIALSGTAMRHFYKVDMMAVKRLGTGLLSFHPVVPEGIGIMFYIHLFLVSTLIAYFPFSKLMHFAGVFFSPTRNLANNSRSKRHINPWNPKVKVHTYEEWEDEFRDVMKDAGMPLEKE